MGEKSPEVGFQVERMIRADNQNKVILCLSLSLLLVSKLTPGMSLSEVIWVKPNLQRGFSN